MLRKYFVPGAVIVATAAILLWPSNADAHHPELSVSSVCVEPDNSLVSVEAKAWEFWDDGQTVSSDRRYNPDVRVEMSNPVSNWVEIGHGEFTDKNNFSFTVNSIQPNSAGAVTVRVRSVGPWGPNGEYESLGDTREAVIDLSDDCTTITTTTKPTTTGGIATTATSPTITTTTEPTNGITITRDIPATPVPLTPRFTG